jgi:hypothetical protein
MVRASSSGHETISYRIHERLEVRILETMNRDTCMGNEPADRGIIARGQNPK